MASEVIPTGAGSHLFPYITLEFPPAATFCRKLRRFTSLCGDYFSVGVKTVRVVVANPGILMGPPFSSKGYIPGGSALSHLFFIFF
jgi:hypothetical protein